MRGPFGGLSPSADWACWAGRPPADETRHHSVGSGAGAVPVAQPCPECADYGKWRTVSKERNGPTGAGLIMSGRRGSGGR
jgi:hypothetical protein